MQKARLLPTSFLDAEFSLITLRAALHLSEPTHIDFAINFCFAQKYSVQDRAKFAFEFLHANLTNEAFAILMADPNIWVGVEEIDAVTKALTLITKNIDSQNISGKASMFLLRTLRGQARARAAAQNGLAINRPHPTTFGFPSELLVSRASLRGPPTNLIFQPGAPVSQQEVFQRAISSGEDSILSARILNPIEWRNVFLSKWGDIWDSSGNVIRRISDTQFNPLASGKDIPEIPILINCCGKEFNKNLYHWFIDIFPSLCWRLDMIDGEIPVAIGGDARPWVRESLILAAKNNVTILPIDDVVFVKRLIALKLNPYALARPDIYSSSFARITDHVDNGVFGYQEAPVYISRRDSKRRPLENEVELENSLQSIGVQPVIFTGLSLLEKIRRIRHAPLVIGPHGAGLTMLAFAKPGRKVLEIIPAQLTNNKIHLCMAQISRMVGHEHHLYLENGIKDRSSATWFADVIDITSWIRNHLNK
jgi:capsular polysaccharide biosynthesis protein